MERQLQPYFTYLLDKGKWSMSCPQFYLWEKSLWYSLDRRLAAK
jgi:hypothetical protein